jgi:hypothetical protein
LDDSVWKGRTIQQTKDTVLSAWPNAEVSLAAFLSHKGAPENLLDRVYYFGLDDEAYQARRNDLIEYLQDEGSLLLDTEHLEVTLKVRGDSERLFRALAGWGRVVRFASGANRINYTVLRDPDAVQGNLLEGVLPPYANLGGAVSKLRIVSRTEQPGSCRVIPILYPSLDIKTDTRYLHPRMSWTHSIAGAERLFQCVGLCLSLELLIDALSCLRSSLHDDLTFDVAAGMDHLKVIFPEFRSVEMLKELDRVLSHKRGSAREGHVDDPGREILNALAEKILDECYDRTADSSGFLRQLRLDEIMRIAPLQGQTEARMSAALDILIDDAKVLPSIQPTDRNGIVNVSRVFGPDGEIVARDIIRKALLAGRGCELDRIS